MGVPAMTYIIIPIVIAVALFAFMAWLMERPAKPRKDWGEIIGSLPTPPWDGMTYEHPGTSYLGVGRHRRR